VVEKMTLSEIKANDQKYYASIHFERTALFECLNAYFDAETLLYIGSSIHITPSFIFPMSPKHRLSTQPDELAQAVQHSRGDA
jgi:hypothetical protein